MSYPELLDLLISKGYDVYDDESKPYNLNIIGHRTPNSTPDYFDDELIVLWKYGGKWYDAHWPITTLPGIPWLLKPVNPHGAAILVAGQYRLAYTIGLHRNKYEALVQAKPVSVYRDSNLDGVFDFNPRSIETGFFGINIHKAGLASKIVGPNSAGCQVFKNSTHFDQFMSTCRLAASLWGNSFTYTLVEY